MSTDTAISVIGILLSAQALVAWLIWWADDRIKQRNEEIRSRYGELLDDDDTSQDNPTKED